MPALKRVSIVILTLCVSAVIFAAVDPRVGKLSWILPAKRLNGVILAPKEISKVNTYLNGSQTGFPLAGNVTSELTTPCVYGNYQVSVTDTKGIESPLSESVFVDYTKTTGCNNQGPPTAPTIKVEVAPSNQL